MLVQILSEGHSSNKSFYKKCKFWQHNSKTKQGNLFTGFAEQSNKNIYIFFRPDRA